jgi:uncharacterized membrane protein YqjE
MPPEQPTSDLAKAIQEVSEKASLLVREEIELAKAEMTEKVTKLAKGAVVGVVAGVFALLGLIYLLHGLAWLIWMVIGGTQDFYLGFVIVALLLFILGGVGGWLAARYFKRGSPPTPQMAIEEAQLIKETVTSSRPAETSPAIRPTQEVEG